MMFQQPSTICRSAWSCCRRAKTRKLQIYSRNV
jgi:hypothetical protein